MTLSQPHLPSRYSAALEKIARDSAELNDSREAKAFSYSLNHDIRAPLRAIQDFTELVLNEHGANLTEATRYLQRVLRAPPHARTA